LLEGIGRKVEAHEIDIPLMKRCITLLGERTAGKAGLGVRQTVPANAFGHGFPGRALSS
jgi:hypothetical protein